jgi:hypothetical protein
VCIEILRRRGVACTRQRAGESAQRTLGLRDATVPPAAGASCVPLAGRHGR